MSEPQPLIAGRYRPVRVIATGGMGVVWEAWDERLERTVAIKQLHTAPGLPEAEAELAKSRAMREARITARLHHPHAVPVFDAVEHEGRPCLIMPFLPSTPLSAVLRERGPLPVADVARLGAQVASALAAAHGLGIVHRDVKPGNILITDDGAAHISDFGISHAMGDPTLTATGMVHGTPAFLAPEVARGGDATFASDVFSLGATLYAALEGRPPFGAEPNSIALLHKVAAAEVEPPTRAGPLTPFLLRMLSAETAERPTMEAVAAHLAATAAVPTEERAAREERAAPEEPAPVVVPVPADVPAVHPSTPEEPLTDEVPPAAPAAEPPAPPAGRPDQHRPATRPPAHARTPSVSAAPSAPAGGAPRRRLLGVLAAAALLVAVVWVVAAMLTGPDPGTTAEPGPTPSSAPSAEPTGDATAAPEESPTPTAPATTPPPTPAPTTQEPEPEPAPAEEDPAPAEEPAPDRATQLASAVVDYYAFMPDDTDAAWPRMTTAYQSGHAGGRESYEAFWADIEDVAVTDVQGLPPDQVEATLTYRFDDGRVVVERTAYRLAEEDGLLKIAASTVLSSTGA
ncbi:serine/threonine-protein kinase [Georgenia muralis]|uniref:non-specific serine/threonine protein kinase n=1 Tax=Georgenia muralis TaxID=154117 RepID=A0A3N4Z7B8_9MICO|nr:serine/threonine-protein kinase [Georgenia muralis]RPF27070.1 serine/threonine protein kinase [Georgenia muralis]